MDVWLSVQKRGNCHISHGLSKANANRVKLDLDQSDLPCSSFKIPAMIKQQATKITREQFEKKSSYCYKDLISFAHSDFEGQGDSRLPLPPMLMLDRITNISAEGGSYGKGIVEAEFDIRPDLWFFACHFENDPVMPGCLGLDALWQSLGFYLGWSGAPGTGRALGLNDLKFSGQVYGEAGTDTLNGGAGADTFVFESASAFSNVDTISDFTTGDGDAINLVDVLSLYDPINDAITDFVQMNTSGSDTLLSVDRDGTGTTYGFTQIATITGVTGLTDEAALVTNGNLIVS